MQNNQVKVSLNAGFVVTVTKEADGAYLVDGYCAGFSINAKVINGKVTGSGVKKYPEEILEAVNQAEETFAYSGMQAAVEAVLPVQAPATAPVDIPVVAPFAPIIVDIPVIAPTTTEEAPTMQTVITLATARGSVYAIDTEAKVVTKTKPSTGEVLQVQLDAILGTESIGNGFLAGIVGTDGVVHISVRKDGGDAKIWRVRLATPVVEDAEAEEEALEAAEATQDGGENDVH